jgi:hypothetical protein
MEDKYNNNFTLSTNHENPFFDIPNFTGTPERRLLLAILERAILDYVGNIKKEIDEATEWLFNSLGHDSENMFSFEWVCHELDLNPSTILEKIRLMPKRGERRIPPWYFKENHH